MKVKCDKQKETDKNEKCDEQKETGEYNVFNNIT